MPTSIILECNKDFKCQEIINLSWLEVTSVQGSIREPSREPRSACPWTVRSEWGYLAKLSTIFARIGDGRFMFCFVVAWDSWRRLECVPYPIRERRPLCRKMQGRPGQSCSYIEWESCRLQTNKLKSNLPWEPLSSSRSISSSDDSALYSLMKVKSPAWLELAKEVLGPFELQLAASFLREEDWAQ